MHRCGPMGDLQIIKTRLIPLLAEIFKTGQVWRCPNPAVCCTQKVEGMCVSCIFVLNSVSPGDTVFGWSSVLRRHIPHVRVCVRVHV